MKITKAAVDALKANATGPRIAWDSRLPGFGIVTHAGGKKV